MTKTTPASNRNGTKPPTYYPSHLSEHRDCAEKFLHRRVLKSPEAPQPDNRALAKGTAAHSMIARFIDSDPSRRAALLGNIEFEAERALKAAGFRGTQADIDKAKPAVAKWARTGIEVVENRFVNARIILVERFLDLMWDQPPIPFILAAKVDLVAVHADDRVEVIDWKSGNRHEIDMIQSTIIRVVVEENLDRLLATTLDSFAPTRFDINTCYFETGNVIEKTFTEDELRAEFGDVWNSVLQIERAKATPVPGTRDWMPQPGWACSYCPFQASCSYRQAAQAPSRMARLAAART